MKKQTAILCALMLSLSAATAFALPQYTGFTTRSTGYVVTASNWNDEFQNFINHMNTHLIGTFNLILGKGRLLSSDGTNIAALTNAGAADNNKMLVLDDTQTLGLRWATPANQIIENKDCSGRLTAFSGVPVATSTTSAATTIYFTPYQGNTIDLFESSQWKKHTFSEITISLSGKTASKNFDVFIYDSGSDDVADAADVVEWTDNSNRATALATQDGVLVKSGATNRRYVGTFRTTSTTGTTAYDSVTRLIWNYYNRVETFGIAGLTTDSWTYSSTSFRSINASTAAKVDFVVGVKEDLVHLDNYAQASGGGDGVIGIGVDSTTVNSADISTEKKNSSSSEYEVLTAHKYLPLDIGFHQVYPLEKAISGTVTFYGDDGGNMQSGMKVTLLM